MMSLRLLRALLSALFGPLIKAIAKRTRTTGERTPSYGPSGPWARHHVAALHPPRTKRAHELHRRPLPVRAPAHILAILAQAPDVEPGLEVRRPADASISAAAHLTVIPVCGPALEEENRPARRRHRPAVRTWLSGIALRLSRGCRAVAEWLVFDSPPPARA